MPVEFPGWITLLEATERYAVAYHTLRQLVKDGVFTRGRFSAASERPPIFLRVVELDAWKAGGITAVAAAKAAYEAEMAAAHGTTPVFGGEG